MSKFYPYPGTDIYDYCVENDLLCSPKSQGESEDDMVLSLPDFSREQIDTEIFFGKYEYRLKRIHKERSKSQDCEKECSGRKKVPEVSIIIPVYNGEQNISQCIAAVLSLDYPKDAYEIIVVDNASTDRTAEIVRDLSVKYVFETNRGIPFARNRGIEESSGKFWRL